MKTFTHEEEQMLRTDEDFKAWLRNARRQLEGDLEHIIFHSVYTIGRPCNEDIHT